MWFWLMIYEFDTILKYRYQKNNWQYKFVLSLIVRTFIHTNIDGNTFYCILHTIFIIKHAQRSQPQTEIVKQ